MKNALKVAVAAALMSMGAAAVAATSTQTSATIYDITHLSAPVNFGFTGFNSALGTLDSVEVTFISDISGRLRAENTAGAQTVTLGSGALLSLQIGSLAPITVSNLYSQNVALGAYDGVTDFTGTSGVRINFSAQPVTSSTGLLTSSAALNAFTSNTLVSSVSGVFAGSGSGNVTFGGSSTVNTYAVLTYNYTPNPVPEPETYAMLLAGLGLVGGIAAKRKAKKAA